MTRADMLARLPAQYLTGFCAISAISAHNLTNTELVGKQDPYVVLEFPGSPPWREQTSSQSNAGSDAHWEDLDFR
eukprot:CAMPEP_0173371486 /NCGR_PEP_ID=MMETSP1144-20121109/27310_1 /TAXON_ID=483371 /ORGANISM="non described non described, Strain CCMP2298" /LENGTH=74 /DNA_ID=CAMNT_0014323237 /DNA_START=8 /DNA_END=229 /DNA_ORIENTATION=-